jgi:MFS family permease
MVVGTMVGGRLYDKVGPRPPVLIGLLATGLATLQLASIDVTTADSTLRTILVVRGLGMGLAMMPVTTFALAEVPLALTSQATSINNVARSVFASLGTAIFASLLTSFQQNNLASMVQTFGQNSVRTVQLLSAIQVALQKAGLAVDAAHELAVSRPQLDAVKPRREATRTAAERVPDAEAPAVGDQIQGA